MIKVIRKLTTDYNLETCYPAIAREWHPFKNGNLKPNEVFPHSGIKAWFLCNHCGEEYMASVGKRTREKEPTGCPFCVGKKVSLKNCLATTHPRLLQEWDYERNAQINLTPYNVVRGSNKKVHWICSNCNKPFTARIGHRALRNQGCKKCSLGTSFPEQFLCFCLESIIGEDYVFNRIQNDNEEEIDIYVSKYLPTFKIGIEYQGRAFHKDVKKDVDKLTNLASDSEFHIIAIRETGLPDISSHFKDSNVYIIESAYTNTSKESLRKVLEDLLETFQEIISSANQNQAKNFQDDAIFFLQNLDIKKISPEIHERMRMSRKKVIPFYKERQDLLKFWDYEKNVNVKPHEFSKSSTKTVHWKCPENHTWQESILQQTKNKTICKKCEHPPLAETQKEVTEELLDKSLAEKLTFGSEKIVDWQCKTCSTIYKMPVFQKVNGKDCPQCFIDTRSLAATHPHLSIEWHKTKNSITSEQVTSGSGRIIVWICDCSNVWEQRINQRTRKNYTGCPSCRNKNKV